MILTVALSILACRALGIAPVLALKRATGSKRRVTLDWIDDLSVERYRPMLRLLDDAELQFLCSRTGVTPTLMAQFRRQRCQIFRGYLRSLQADFTKICRVMKVLLVEAAADRPDLASLLVHSQIAFAWSIALVQLRLALYSCGIGTVNAASLLRLFDGLKVELQALSPAGISAAA